MMLKLYNFLHIILWPLINIYIWLRVKKGKETKESVNAKKANFLIKRPKGKLIWFHVASVGEAMSVIPLLNEIAKTDKLKILVSSGTLTSAQILKSRIPKQAIYHPIPYDRPIYIKKFLQHFKPNMVILIESEIWPNIINIVKKANIPLMLGSARISPKSKLKWFFYSFFLRSSFQKFDCIIPQDQYTKDCVEKMASSDKITKIANLKMVGDPLPFQQDELVKLENHIAGRPVFLAASTHSGEEKLIAKCHQKLKQDFNNLLTIIVPRHPNRSLEIRNLLTERNLNTAIRSNNEQITNSTDIYLADTLGELGLFYNLVDFAFIGGSLVNQGGHNPLEAARANCATIHGPYIQNFADIYQEFSNLNATIKINDISELAEKITELLKAPENCKAITNSSNKIIASNQTILNHYIKLINSSLK